MRRRMPRIYQSTDHDDASPRAGRLRYVVTGVVIVMALFLYAFSLKQYMSIP
jgi:hypothetical protein